MPFIDVTMDRSLLYSQLGSLVIALLVVIVIVGAILRSPVAGYFCSNPDYFCNYYSFWRYGLYWHSAEYSYSAGREYCPLGSG